MTHYDQWEGFKGRLWRDDINVRDFIQNNYTPYEGDESFLEGPTEATNKLWAGCRSCSGKNGRRAASWIWRQRLFPA